MDNLLGHVGQLVVFPRTLRNASDVNVCIADGLLLRPGHVLDDDVSQ